MKQKLFSLLFAIVASIGTMFADGTKIGDLYYNLNATDKTAEVTCELYRNANNYKGLTTANIPASVTYSGTTYSVTSIGEWAFSYCSSLTSVTIPNSVTSIGMAFDGCSGLISLSVEAGNTVYDSRNNCNAIIETSTNTLIVGCQNTTIPNSVTSIGTGAFFDCSSLTSVTIPNSVSSIGRGAFSGCSGLTSLSVEAGNTVYDSRNNCNAIIETSTNTLIFGCQNTTIPNSVTSIGDLAFYGCTGLTSVTIPNSVTSIGEWAFSYCYSLTSVTIGNSVTSIGNYAFQYCFSLTSVTCEAVNPPALGYDVFDEVDKSIPLYVPAESVDAYKAADQWKDFTNILPITISDDQFTLISRKDGSIIGLKQIASHQTLEYSFDGNTWTNMTTATTIALNNGVSLYVRGKLTANNTQTDFSQFTITGSVEAKGNINYLWNYETLNASLKQMCAYRLFDSCAGLKEISALILPASTLVRKCYKNMFIGCTDLTDISNFALPATILADSCYDNMFLGCSKLTSLPYLPATTLAPGCYRGMFANCTSVTTAMKLPATTLAKDCYGQMFQGCTALITAPELPATKLAYGCYYAMFSYCSSLTVAPKLPAVTLADRCYYNMFRGSGLVNAPILPATTLADGCYMTMFLDCSSLIKATALRSTILAKNCYRGMFQGCTALTTPPAVLPALTLADTCYRSMFNGCTSIEKAPVLPAKTLTNECYRYMFSGCSSLNYIKCLATNISASGCTNEWVKNVASTGTFVCPNSMTAWSKGNNGVPNGWTIEKVIPYVVKFDANGGVFTQFSTINGHATGLDADHKTGYVVVYGGKTSFYSISSFIQTTRERYTFLGWYTAKTGGEQVYDATGHCVAGTYWDADNKWIGTADLQLYAQWSPFTYTITWKNDDGSVIDQTTVEYGVIPTHADPVKANTAEYSYTFVGWTPELTEATEDATYTATFSRTLNIYTISANATHGEIEGTGEYAYGTEVELTAIPDNGYHFDHWEINLNQEYIFVVAFSVPSDWTNPVAWVWKTGKYGSWQKLSKEGNMYVYRTTEEDMNIIVVPNGTTWENGQTEDLAITENCCYTITNSYTVNKNYDCLNVITASAIIEKSNPLQISLTEDQVVNAYFSPNVYTINDGSNAKQGYIDGIGSFDYMSELQINAIPNYGYHFTHWSDGNTDNPRTIVLTQDTMFVAEFAIDKSGTCGDDNALTWTFDDKGVLTISGSGALNSNYTFGLEAPESMEKVVIESGVSSVGNGAFKNKTTLNEIAISHGVNTIKAEAFAGCSEVTTITLGANLQSIGDNAFNGCKRIEEITVYAERVIDITETTFANIGNKKYVYVNVPEGSLRKYERDDYWSEFDLRVIGATTTTVAADEVSVEPASNTADVTWPAVENAATYELTIKDKDGNVICTLVFNAQGQLTSIAFAAPGRGQRAEQVAGFTFTVTGLDSGSTYGFRLDTKNSQGEVIDTKTGTFTTTGGIATAVDNASLDTTPVKVLRDGQLFILRDGNTYTIQGQEVR